MYTSSHFQSFLIKSGIIHRKSCQYTSQQNGLDERKLHHILEMGLTLLAHCHLSNKYWIDVFLTRVHTINFLSTPCLGQLSRYSNLYDKDPDHTKFRVFGCKCFPLLCLYGHHKLEFRSKPCIFLGYHHARFKCLELVSSEVYLSRHVIFDEKSFLAKDQATIALPSNINAQNDVPFRLQMDKYYSYIRFSPYRTHCFRNI